MARKARCDMHMMLMTADAFEAREMLVSRLTELAGAVALRGALIALGLTVQPPRLSDLLFKSLDVLTLIEEKRPELPEPKVTPHAYSPMSRRLREEGKVLLVRVSAQGMADNVQVRKSSGHARLDEAALEAVRHWRSVPAKRVTEVMAAVQKAGITKIAFVTASSPETAKGASN